MVINVIETKPPVAAPKTAERVETAVPSQQGKQFEQVVETKDSGAPAPEATDDDPDEDDSDEVEADLPLADAQAEPARIPLVKPGELSAGGDASHAADAAQSPFQVAAGKDAQGENVGADPIAARPAAAPIDMLQDIHAKPARAVDAAEVSANPTEPNDFPVSDQPTATVDALGAEVIRHISRESRLEAAQIAFAHRQPQIEPKEIVSQLSGSLKASDKNQIEITLTPEELGKVRIVITPGERPAVAVYADNAQTLDLLRRHADVLSRELRDTGFAGASLSFSDREQAGTGQQSSGQNTTPGGQDLTPASPNSFVSVAPRPILVGRQIDIRI